jgi:hypothetical protein
MSQGRRCSISATVDAIRRIAPVGPTWSFANSTVWFVVDVSSPFSFLRVSITKDKLNVAVRKTETSYLRIFFETNSGDKAEENLGHGYNNWQSSVLRTL